eukprot:gene16652-2350_t
MHGGDVAGAIERKDRKLLFTLKQEQLLELIRTGDTDAALDFAARELAPQGPSLLPCSLLCAVLCAGGAAAVPAHGVVRIDAFSFDNAHHTGGCCCDKIVDGNRTVLVKFDKEYPFGEAEDQFADFAASVASLPSILVTEVCVQQYGDDKYNEKVRDRFGIKNSHFPAFRLFPKGLASWSIAIAAESPIHPATNAPIHPEVKPGCVKAFDRLANKMKMGDRHAILDKATALAEK